MNFVLAEVEKKAKDVVFKIRYIAMPIYEYHCNHCKQSIELLQKLSDVPAKTCPHCHHGIYPPTACRVDLEYYFVH